MCIGEKRRLCGHAAEWLLMLSRVDSDMQPSLWRRCEYRLFTMREAYIDDVHIGYVGCKEPICLMKIAYMFRARSVYVQCKSNKFDAN